MDHIDLYAKFLKRKFSIRRNLRVVVDCSDGTAGLVLERLEDSVKDLELILINEKPDGNFPAHGPNPLVPGAMSGLEALVRREKADLGIAFDADGDRVFFVDDRGRSVDAHEAGYALMQMFKPPFVVSEIASWRLKRTEGALISSVGHYFFKNLMRKNKASLGLEHSGHFYFKNFYYCDSGILAAVMMINFVSGLEGGLSSWLDSLPKFYRSGEINFKVPDKDKILSELEEKYGKLATGVSKIDGLTLEFNGDYWINLRPSNTENLLRLNIESTDPELAKKITFEISDFISGRRLI